MTIAGRTDEARPSVPAAPRATGRWADALVATGLVVLVLGTFLPWLRSGTSERASYAADGVLRSLVEFDGLTGAVLRVWPFLSLTCAVSLGLVILRITRTGTALATLSALAAAVVCVRVLSIRSTALVGVATTGPAITLAGSAVVLAAAAATVITALFRRPRRSR